MRHRPLSLLLPSILLLLAASDLDAQTASRFSLQGSGLYVGVFGDAFEGLDSGVGLEAQARYTPSAFSIGVGFQASRHTINFEDVDEDVTLSGPFIEPRYVLDIGNGRAAPYVSGRLAFLQQSADVDAEGTTFNLSTSGTQINVGGGLLVRLSRNANLDLGLTLGRIGFGDVELSGPGFPAEEIAGTSGNGQNLVLRIGGAIGIGR